MIKDLYRFCQQHPTYFLWLSLIIWIAIIFMLFITPSQKSDDGHILMPLDDTYIHFQYARQLAEGQPYVYNDGQPPTSGATSFLYPFWLALGYRLGFTSLNLALWALISGAGALLLTAFASWRYLQYLIPDTTPRLATLALLLTTGAFLWHYVSGMETGILIALILLTLKAFTARQPAQFAIFATALALTRPEGSIMALIAACLALIIYPQKRLIYALPLLAPFIQPTLNALITGSWVASGNQSKSILAMIPNDTALIIERIADNLLHITLELLTGYNANVGWYTLPLVGFAGLIGILSLLRTPQTRSLAILLILWGVAITGAIATLDNAFWHFKRYQMPLYVLLMLHTFLIPSKWLTSHTLSPIRRLPPVMLLIVISSAITLMPFIQHHVLNTRYVYQQPYQMAQWLRTNTPSSALVAVHDVGLMRYYGERTTLDKVGLTTPDAAIYWRNGVGSVGEFLIQQRPDYIASYGQGHGYGLALLANTPLYGIPLATFTVANWQPHANVALAAPTQAIYRPDWAHTQPLNNDAFAMINVANITSETTMHYTWQNATPIQGFATEFHHFDHYNCHTSHCTWMAGGRRINGEERFDLPPSTDTKPTWLRTILHPSHAGELDIYLGNTLIDTQIIPQIPGYWFTIETPIPATPHDPHQQIRIVPRFQEPHATYNPFQHEFFTAPLPKIPPSLPDAPTFANGAFQLAEYNLNHHQNQLTLDLTWHVLTWHVLTPPDGDYRFFVHIIAQRDQPPITQTDTYLGGQPIGNWQAGEKQHTLVVDLENIPAGTYEVAIGFYHPQTGQRLPITPADANRLIINTLEIP